MDSTLIVASIAMVLALIFYTFGVWGEKLSGTIKVKHLISFLIGLILDTTGTILMRQIAQDGGGSKLGIHQVTGGLAVTLMLIHLIWAVFVYVKGDENAKKNFHKFSIVVWLIWLISFILGMLVGMNLI
ncbi:MAG: HsmA family protein [Senegalia sp. (in: firmicutes)]|uniref:HsmA family protein n=1 Tax=Senegalia sp. (in: firmicutes) TaxID=1924098 RepID=UPI003F9682B2